MADMQKKDLVIQNIVVGLLDTNCYVVYRDDSPECIVVDPGGHADEILAFMKSQGLEAKGIFLTHGHFDHIQAIEEIQRQMRSDVYVGEAERELLMDVSLNNPVGHPRKTSLEADHCCKDGQVIEIADMKIQVIHTPGHTGGSVCYYIEGESVLFSGDTLFFESIGRTDLPTGNPAMILRSIEERLFVLPENIRVLPGHGPETTIGYEKDNNPYFGTNGIYS